MTPQEKTALQQRRQQIAQLYIRGVAIWQIAAVLRLDQNAVNRDLRAVQSEWRAATEIERGNRLATELARLDEVEKEAWTNWSRASDLRSLDLVVRCVRERAGLLGLVTKEELIPAPTVVLDWDSLLRQQTPEPVDLVEQRLRQEEIAPPLPNGLRELEGNGEQNGMI